MSVTTTVLFDHPQREIASLIQERLAACESAKIVTGFATPGGLAAIAKPIKVRPGILSTLIVGSGTYPAFQALDELISAGVSPGSLFVHLGHTVLTGGKANPYARFHPMLHSKIYYFEMPDGTASAFIGSNNLTSFAMRGLNGEASVLLEGSKQDQAFIEILKHIAEAQHQSTLYDPSMKAAYAFWTRESLDGLKVEVAVPQEQKSIKTILVFAVAEKGQKPEPREIIFFEIPLGIKAVDTCVHLFLLDSLPASPSAAIALAATTDRRFECIVRGVDDNKGYAEVPTNWKILDPKSPVLERVASGSFRPSNRAALQQVCAMVKGRLSNVPNYLFEARSDKWSPIFSDNPSTNLSPDYGLDSANQNSDPDVRYPVQEWQLVRGLEKNEKEIPSNDNTLALNLVKPWSGSFTLVSTAIAERKHKNGRELFDR